jgi:hypothetical protein
MNAASISFGSYVQYFILAAIIASALALRLLSADFPVLYDFDSWWFFRHAQEIYENGFVHRSWDPVSFFPPGRPVSYALGWPYTIVGSYVLTDPFHDMDLMRFSGLFVAVFASFVAIPAYFLGREVTNGWGGLVTAALAVFSTVFVTHSMAGRPDTDGVVAFYTIVIVLFMFYAFKKARVFSYDSNALAFLMTLARYLPYVVPVLLSYWLFAVNWSPAWYIYFIFVLFIPALVLFRVLEAKIIHREKGHLALTYEKIRQSRDVIVPVFLIGLFGELFSVLFSGFPFSMAPTHRVLISSLNFAHVGVLESAVFVALLALVGSIVGVALARVKGLLTGAALGVLIALTLLTSGVTGESLIVNTNVAELQPIDVFTVSGQLSLLKVVGAAPVVMGTVGLFGMLLFKVVRKHKVSSLEYFVLFWVLGSLLLVGLGGRFSLQLSLALATGAGVLVGNITELYRGRGRKAPVLHATTIPIFALIIIGTLHQIYGSYSAAEQVKESIVSEAWVEALTWLDQNAKDNALVVSWWSHGHLISGFTGLRVHSDGAHCSSVNCVPYDMDTRIIDAGKILIADKEDEALGLLRKYRSLSDEECQEVRERFAGVLPENNACEAAGEVFVLVSRHMVDFYHYIYYYGTYDFELGSGKPRFSGYQSFELSESDDTGNFVYGDGQVVIEVRDGQIISYLQVQEGLEMGPRRTLIRETAFFDDEGGLHLVQSSDGGAAKRLVWIAPGMEDVTLMDPVTRENLLTRLFFLQGRGLEHFEIAFENSEVKIYRVLL